LYGSDSTSVMSPASASFAPRNSPRATLKRSATALNPSSQPIVCPTTIAPPGFTEKPYSTRSPSMRVAKPVKPTRQMPGSSSTSQ
jgi:hypothetical protein